MFYFLLLLLPFLPSLIQSIFSKLNSASPHWHIPHRAINYSIRCHWACMTLLFVFLEKKKKGICINHLLHKLYYFFAFQTMTEAHLSSITPIAFSTSNSDRVLPDDPRYQYMQSMKSWTESQLHSLPSSPTEQHPQQQHQIPEQANSESSTSTDMTNPKRLP